LPGGPWAYIYAVDAPYSAASLDGTFGGARELGIDYGQAMMKTALLLGWEPVLAEYQIIDSTAVLHAAANEAFYELVDLGFIHLSYFREVRSYWDSLAAFLSGGGITSAWSVVGSHEMLENLELGATRTTDAWGDRYSEQMLEGLLTLDALRARLQEKVVHTSDTFRLHASAERIVSQVFPAGTDAQSTGNMVASVLREVAIGIPQSQQGLRSRWIEDILNGRYLAAERGEHSERIAEAAVTAITLGFNEEAARVVAGGAALRSTALTSVAFNENVSHILSPSEALQEEVVRSAAAPAARGVAIALQTSIPTLEQDLEGISKVSWSTVRDVVKRPTFRVRIDKANRSPTGREAYFAWLEDQIQVSVRLENLSNTNERITVGAEMVRKLPPMWALETIARVVYGSPKWDRKYIEWRSAANAAERAATVVGSLRQFAVPAPSPGEKLES
jgi:hypothetical protein